MIVHLIKFVHISAEVGLFPFTHGSALFTRGRTQALVTVTLVVVKMNNKLKPLWMMTAEWYLYAPL